MRSSLLNHLELQLPYFPANGLLFLVFGAALSTLTLLSSKPSTPEASSSRSTQSCGSAFLSSLLAGLLTKMVSFLSKRTELDDFSAGSISFSQNSHSAENLGMSYSRSVSKYRNSRLRLPSTLGSLRPPVRQRLCIL